MVQIFLLGGDNTGVIHSSNYGINWTPTSSSVTGINIKSLTISGNKVFAGTAGNGICVTQDNGATWATSNNGLGSINSTVKSLTNDNGKIYAIIASSVYISQNNGLNWNLLNTPFSTSAIAAIGNKLFVGTDSGLYISSNFGSNWSLLNTGIEFITYYAAFCALDTNNIYFLGKGVYYSDNLGSNWSSINTAGMFSNESIAVLKVHGSNIFAGLGSGLWKSADSGLHWDFIPLGTLNYSVQCIAIEDSNIILGTVLGKILFSNDYGLNWLVTTNLPTNGSISQIAYFGGNIYACNAYGVYLSADNGNSWTSYNSGLPSSPNPNPTSFLINGAYMYLGCFYFGIYRRNINSGNWTSLNATLPSNAKVMTISAIDTTIFIGTFDDGIYRSTDNGDNWVGINNGINYYTIRAITANDSILLAGTDESGMYISYDQGGNWININNGIPLYSSILAIETLNNEIFAGSAGQRNLEKEFK
jgi:photosystem II stability/assembly factor-like uncharacterized protein